MYWCVLGCVVGVEYIAEWVVSWYSLLLLFAEKKKLNIRLGYHSTTRSK